MGDAPRLSVPPALQAYVQAIFADPSPPPHEQLELAYAALSRFRREENPRLWAFLHVLAGQLVAIGVDPEDAPRLLGEARRHYEQALAVYTAETDPQQWAVLHRSLALVYITLARLGVDVDANARKSIEHTDLAGPLLRQDEPAAWATDQLAAAEALTKLLERDGQVNTEAAVGRLRAALDVLAPEDDPQTWIDLNIALADALVRLGLGDRALLDEAAARYELCLGVLDPANSPAEWGRASFGLGLVWLERAEAQPAERYGNAYACLAAAIESLGRAGLSVERAAAQRLLGKVFVERPSNDKHADVRAALDLYAVIEQESNAARPALLSALLRGARADAYLAIGEEDPDANELALQTLEGLPEVLEAIGADTELSGCHHRLGLAWLQQGRGDRADNLDRAVDEFQLALDLVRPDAPPSERGHLHNNLGEAYRLRIHGDRAENIDRCIVEFENAAAVYGRDKFPAEWALAQRNLGVAYRVRISGDRAANLEEAIRRAELAAEVFTPESFPERAAQVHDDLGTFYVLRIRGSRADNVETAIAHLRDALALREDLNRPRLVVNSRSNLAMALLDRLGGDRRANVEEALTHLSWALERTDRADFPGEWSGFHHNLAAAYQARIAGDRAENLERAIRHCEQALEVRTRSGDPENWAATQQVLSNCQHARIIGDRADNNERALAASRRALEVYTRDAFPAAWSHVMGNMALVLLDRTRGDRGANIEEAIAAAETATTVASRAASPDEWARLQNILGMAYQERAAGDRAENIERAIECYRKTLEVRTREAFPERWAETENNLGLTYLSRLRGDRSENLEEAIAHIERALQVYKRSSFPIRWAQMTSNLAYVYGERVDGDRDVNDQVAIELCHQALSEQPLAGSPGDRFRTARNLGDIHFRRREWAAAHNIYAVALETGLRLISAAHTELGREAEVAEVGRFYANDAYSLVQLGGLEAAFLRLEQGKTRALAEALALANADLKELAPEDASALRAAREKMRGLEAQLRLAGEGLDPRLYGEHSDALEQAREELDALVGEIRVSQPGFMRSELNLPELLALAPAGGALVAPLITSEGSVVFVVPAGRATVEPEDVRILPDLDTEVVDRLLIGTADDPGWLAVYLDWSRDVPGTPWLPYMETGLRALWDVLMVRVYERLLELGVAAGATVVMLLQGRLAVLPLHAAWRSVSGERRYFLDDYVVRYSPSGSALAHSEARLRGVGQERRLLAVINPSGGLTHTEFEGERAVGSFGSGNSLVLGRGTATRDAVLARLADFSYVHFACHGTYNWADVTASGLLLAKGDLLTLSHVISSEVDLRHSRLVTMSACETGLTEFERSPDEYVGLPAGFLRGGAPAVLSTLWQVADLSTALLVAEFYRLHIEERLPIEHALRGAQIWLRGLSSKEAMAELAGRPPTARTDDALASESPCPFAHPHYWAPFVLTGI